MDLHVTNISPLVTKFELRALFDKVVPVQSVTMLEGDALVTLESIDDARKALDELDGSMLDGRILSMRLALPRKERQDSIANREEEDKGKRQPAD